MVYQVDQVDRIALLRQAALDLRGYEVSAALNHEFALVWQSLDSLVSDSTWHGSVPRTLSSHPLLRSVSRFPPVGRKVQSPFGQFDMGNWSWVFVGRHDTLWATIDPAAVAAAVERIDSDFEFRGASPLPGEHPWGFDPMPVRPRADLPVAIEHDRHRAVVMFASEGAFFLLLIVVGVYLIYRTVRKSAELGRRQHNFVSAVTHELKAPLASVKLYAETLLRPEIGPAQEREFLDRMLQDIARLDHLVDNTLLAGRLEEKGFHLDLKPADLSRAITEYENGLKGYLERHRFALACQIEPGIQAVIDYDALRRVVECLIENAVKYSGDAGKGELTLARVGTKAMLSLKDSGVGIPANELDKVFGAFYRVGDEMTRQIKGTGLGLYLVREIVAAHGGDVSIASAGPGQGTTVKVELPASG